MSVLCQETGSETLQVCYVPNRLAPPEAVTHPSKLDQLKRKSLPALSTIHRWQVSFLL